MQRHAALWRRAGRGATTIMGLIIVVSACSAEEVAVEPTASFRLVESPPSQEFSPNADGQDDALNLRFTFSGPADVAVAIHGAASEPTAAVRSLDLAADDTGIVDILWDGADAAGVAVPEGDYVVAVTATDPGGTTVEGDVTVTVAGGPVIERIGPTEGQALFGQIPLGLVARPGATFEAAEFRVDGEANPIPLIETTPGRWTTTWDADAVAPGDHVLSVAVTWVDKWGMSHEYVDAGVPFSIAPILDEPAPVEVRLRGQKGDEDYQVLANGEVIGSGTASTSWATLTFELDRAPTRIEVRFVNDYYVEGRTDRNVRIDWVSIMGQTYESEDPSTYSTGTFVDGQCIPGYFETEELHCNGGLVFEHQAAGL